MAIIGRASGVSDLVVLVGAKVDKNITSANNGALVYFDIPSNEFELNTSIDPIIVTTTLMGVIRAVTLNGNGVNQGEATIVTKGQVPFLGAMQGQIFFIETDGAIRTGVPDAPAQQVRVGACVRAGYIAVDIDVTAAQIAILRDTLQGQIDELQTTIEEIQAIVDPERVDDYGADDDWGTNVLTVNTNFGTNDNWGESATVLFDSHYGSDDNWGTLVA